MAMGFLNQFPNSSNKTLICVSVLASIILHSYKTLFHHTVFLVFFKRHRESRERVIHCSELCSQWRDKTEEQGKSSYSKDSYSKQVLTTSPSFRASCKTHAEHPGTGGKTLTEVSGCLERSRASLKPGHNSSISHLSCLSSTATSTSGTSELWSDGLLTHKAPRQCSFIPKGLLLQVY